MSILGSSTPNTPLFDSKGNLTLAWRTWFRAVTSVVNEGFDPEGNYQGPIGTHATIAGRVTLASIVQNIDTGGIVEAAGIDFARAYINKDTDHIADGTGSPLAGGKAAEVALVTSPPAPEVSKWVNGLVGGVFTKTQPAFSDIADTADPTQIPNLSDLHGQITEGQLPGSGLTVVITTAQLTPLGSQGSMTFTNGILTAQVQAT